MSEHTRALEYVKIWSNEEILLVIQICQMDVSNLWDRQLDIFSGY